MMLLAFPLILLTACVKSIDVQKPQLPAVPLGLTVCANLAVPAIPGERGTALTKEQAANSLAEQRASALSKDRCVKDNQAWYLDLRKSLSK